MRPAIRFFKPFHIAATMIACTANPIAVAVAEQMHAAPVGLQGHSQAVELGSGAGAAGGGVDGGTPMLKVPAGRRHLLFESITRSDRADKPLADSERGAWSGDLTQRAAAPWEFLSDGVAVDSEAWLVTDEHGVLESGFRAMQSEIGPVKAEPRRELPGRLTPELVDRIGRLPPDTLVSVMIQVRDDATPVLPRAPRFGTLSVDDYQVAATAHKQALEEQADRFAFISEGLVWEIEAVGGRVLKQHANISWLSAQVPVGELWGLAWNPDVIQITSDEAPIDGANPVALGDLRAPAFLNVKPFWDSGNHGENGSSAPILVGITETQGMEDEACFLDDVGTGSNDTCDTEERLKGKFVCDAAGCARTSNFTDEGSHGTIVASIIGADYTQDQGVGYLPALSAGWEDRATGIAKEVNVHYYDVGDESTIINAFDCASGDDDIDDACRRVDVSNTSLGWTEGRCSPTSKKSSEAGVENLWDSGALPVIIAHNQGGHPTCKTTTPGDIPKAFTVAALAASSTRDYADWDIADYSNNGGADIEIGGVLREGTMSITDLAAPGNPNYVTTRLANGYGDVSTSYGGSGTSFAAPMVAGAAAAVKDWMFAGGQDWIDFPGRLHTIMLAMGDRGTKDGGATWPGCVKGDRIVCGADTYFGLGRLKLKKPDLATAWTYTVTPSTADPIRTMAFGGLSMPNDTKIAKCVLQQREDMVDASGGGGKDDISLIGLWVRVRDKVNGQCLVGQGAQRYYRWDALYDDKHMVTILDNEVNLGGRCLEVDFDRVYLSSDNYVTYHAYCYADDQLDY